MATLPSVVHLCGIIPIHTQIDIRIYIYISFFFFAEQCERCASYFFRMPADPTAFDLEGTFSALLSKGDLDGCQTVETGVKVIPPRQKRSPWDCTVILHPQTKGCV